MTSVANRCMKPAPHCAPKPAPPAPTGQPRIVLHVLGDYQLPRLPVVDFAVDPLQQAPAVREVGARIVVASVDISDPSGGVEAQAVAAALLQPAQRVVADECGPRPGRSRAGCRPRAFSPVVVEIDAALAVGLQPSNCQRSRSSGPKWL